ncbi:unnamed protein product [Rotaria sordida]|uniref:Uncharacterized protein n=1 Tax=Rotaria sordida TaxID=392033 RepID=A0A813SB46_9BILA|nr:unnamed protein product [Rotaria sordida]CAF0881003.1 unnamed protein product [Rotaria sordida]CAF3850172.1 unnamed protein product [Rotaria sordida]CAF4006892.1 unnamed protein product [Rotaria sordida]
MFSTEALQDIAEDAASELGDDAYYQDDDLAEETDIKTNIEDNSNRPATTKSVHLQQSRPRAYDFSANNLRRDQTIERIIDSRRSSIIENEYTNLAQITSQNRRSPHVVRLNSIKSRSMTIQTENDIHNNDIKDRIVNSQNSKNIPLTSTLQFDNEKWDDGLNTDFDKQSIASIDKSSLQIYEDTCKRLNICPCSMIIRSLNTTKINLENYGLGSKGSAALAVALVRNTTVVSLNLSGNNIGSGGMSYIYQILMDNTFIEEYNLSYNNLGTKGIRKLAAGVVSNAHIKTLNIAGNELTASDINIFLSKLEDHSNLKDLNLSHNKLDKEGGVYVAKWLSDNSTLLNLDVSWCSIRLMGARALAEAIGSNNKLISLNLSNNSFINDTVEFLTNSLTRNMTLNILNLSGNQIFCRYDTRIKEDPSILITGKESFIYKMFVAAATNQALKIFQIGKNHLDARCIMIMLEALSKLDNISLEELDLTGLTLSLKQNSDIHKFFENHPKFTCYVGPIRQTVEHFANNLLNSIHKHCKENQINLGNIFKPNEENFMSNSTITYDEFREGLKTVKIPFPVAQIENIMKYLGRDDDEGTISFSSLEME